MDEAALREQLAMLGASLFQRGYSVGTAGNISVRLPDEYIMTPVPQDMDVKAPLRVALVQDIPCAFNGSIAHPPVGSGALALGQRGARRIASCRASL